MSNHAQLAPGCELHRRQVTERAGAVAGRCSASRPRRSLSCAACRRGRALRPTSPGSAPTVSSAPWANAGCSRCRGAPASAGRRPGSCSALRSAGCCRGTSEASLVSGPRACPQDCGRRSGPWPPGSPLGTWSSSRLWPKPLEWIRRRSWSPTCPPSCVGAWAAPAPACPPAVRWTAPSGWPATSTGGAGRCSAASSWWWSRPDRVSAPLSASPGRAWWELSPA